MPEQDDRLAGLDPLVGVAETISEGEAGLTAEEHRRAVAEEYGQYVATAAITHDGARAYNIGDPVPAANVERWGYLDAGLVAKVGTAAQRKVTEHVIEATAPAMSQSERKTARTRKAAATQTDTK